MQQSHHHHQALLHTCKIITFDKNFNGSVKLPLLDTKDEKDVTFYTDEIYSYTVHLTKCTCGCTAVGHGSSAIVQNLHAYTLGPVLVAIIANANIFELRKT